MFTKAKIFAAALLAALVLVCVPLALNAALTQTQNAAYAYDVSDDGTTLTISSGDGEPIFAYNQIYDGDYILSEDGTAIVAFDLNHNIQSPGSLANYISDHPEIKSIVFNIPDSVTTFGIGNNNLIGQFNSQFTDVTINGKNLTTLGNSLFSNLQNLKSIKLPDTIKTVGDYAFSSCKIANINIPNAETIGVGAFAYNQSLKEINLPNVKTIGNYAFSGCYSLEEAILSDNLTSIGDRAFTDCKLLKSIKIGEAVTEIGIQAFFNCTSINKIEFNAINCADFNVNDNVFGSNFEPTTEATVTFGEKVTRIPAYLFYAYSTYGNYYHGQIITADGFNGTAITIPDSVLSIGAYAFKDHDRINDVVIGNGVKTIGESAFEGICSSDRSYSGSITIGKGVETIGDKAFAYCTKLTEIDFNATECEYVTTGLFARAGADVMYGGIEVTFGSNVKCVPANLFSNESLSNYAKIVRVMFAKGDDDSFAECISIGESAFNNCIELSEAEIPENVVNLGKGNSGVYSAFKYCIALERLAFNAINCGNSYTNFQNAGKGSKLKVTFGELVTKVPDYLFYDCYLYSVDFEGNACTSIGENAFSGNSNGTLEYVKLPQSITEIKNFAFSKCSLLKSINLQDATNLTSIGNSAFYGCTSLEDVVIPDGVEKLDYGAFQNCTSLKNVTLGKDLKTIGNSVFNSCENLLSIELPDGVTSIGDGAFGGCESLKVISIPDSVNKIGEYVFWGCNSLKTVYLPDNSEGGVTYGANMFGSDKNWTDLDVLLISANPKSYENDLKTNLGANSGWNKTYYGIMLFLIDVNLIDAGDNSTVETIKKLCYNDYKGGYDYVLHKDGYWIKDSVELPVQSGYSSSVWRFGSPEGKIISSVNSLDVEYYNTSFAVQKYIDHIDLYATYVDKPEAQYSLSYGETYTYEAFLQKFVKDHEYFTVKEIGEITDAGEYEITVNLVEAYGEWAEDAVITVTVNPLTINLYNKDALMWGIYSGEDNSGKKVYEDLRSGTLYIYGNEAFLQQQTDKGEFKVKTVTNSYTRFNGNDIQIEIQNVDDRYTVSNYRNNKAGTAGAYTASVVITPSKNYTVALGLATDIFTRGLSVEANGDGTYTVTKEWFIVTMVNYLTTEDRETQYSISPIREYADGMLPEAPYMAVVSDDDENNITFIFGYKDTPEPIYSGSIDKYGFYVNNAMPAGEYTISFRISQFVGTDINGESVTSPAFERSFNLTVLPKQLTQEQINTVNSALKGRKYEHNVDSGVNFYDSVAADELAELFTHNLHPEAEGTYWAVEKFNGFDVTFNLNRMNSTAYEPFSYYTGDTGFFKGQMTPDTYTVYYQLSAPNYEPLVNVNDDNGRRNYFFTVVIYQNILVPDVSGVTYTYNGSEVKPNIAYNTQYEVIWQSGVDYINAGDYSFKLKLFDAEHYRWSGKDVTVEGDSNEYAVLEYTIERVNNKWTLSPKLSGWSWGGFDVTVNVITSTAMYGESADTLYSILDKNGNEIAGLVDFRLDEKGQIPASLVNNFKSLIPETYQLIAKVKGGVGYNYNALDNIGDAREFVIVPAVNGWKVSVNVIGWYYNEYDKSANLILGETYFGNVAFTVKDADGNVCIDKFTLTDGMVSDEVAVKLNNLSRGTYSLIASVSKDETNYTSVNDALVNFKVESAPNYWEKIPDIVGWSENNFDKTKNFVVAEARHGNDNLVLVIKDEKGNVLEYTDIDELFASLEIGTYTLYAYVEGTSDYSALDGEITFVVSEDTISLKWLQIALGIFIIFDIVAAGVVITILIFRRRKIEADFREMVHTELNKGDK